MHSAIRGAASGVGARRASTSRNVAARASGTGKTVIITGANTGIGYESAKALVSKDYDIVMACRDPTRMESAKARLGNEVPSAAGKISTELLDLASLESVRDFTKRYLDSGRQIDVLLNNAGVMAPPLMRTKDGFELQIGVNHLGHFLLTTGLSPLLMDPARPSRVVTVSSTAHLFGRINFDDLNSEIKYQEWVAYGQSKLANIYFTYELARRLPNSSACTANTLHPGVINTELARYLLPEDPAWWQRPLMEVMKKFTLTPEQGAQTSIYLCSSPAVEGVSGKYYDKCEPVSSSPISYDVDVAKRLWDVSMELTAAPELAKGV
ncbi:unnamed protein product [Pedinophyceae sp. YPF-701]|nr:unnamed protein product [Pedinophyceae sp. YPF-701]